MRPTFLREVCLWLRDLISYLLFVCQALSTHCRLTHFLSCLYRTILVVETFKDVLKAAHLE